MKRIVYGSILIAGLVFAILEYTVASNPVLANTIVLATVFLLGLIHLFLEWRYYREHNALLASFQFIVIPIALLLVGNIFAPIGIGQGLIEINFNIFNGITAVSSFISIALIIPVIFIFRLMARYYDGRYPAFVIRRRQFGRLALPFFIHLLSAAAVIGLSILLAYIDVISLIYVLLTPIQMVQKLIIPKLQSRSRQRSRYREDDRRGFLSSILGDSRSGRRRRSNSGSRLSSRPSNRGDVSSSSQSSSSSSRRRPGAPVSTTPSDGYREIPTRSRNSQHRPSRSSSSQSSQRSSSSSRRSRSRSSSSSRPIAEIDDGMEAVTPSKRRKVKSSKVSNYLPKGNYDLSDLRCMVCYEDFRTNSRKNIVICPACKFPAHEVEFKAWLNSSEHCPRCNQAVRNNRGLKSGLVAESQYAKFIRKL